jgi:anaerobic magnesium-protoporphyrin IX monomethyl ester cyclase
VKRRGLHAEIDFGFDDARILSAEAMAQIKAAKLTDVEFTEVAACGGPSTLPTFSEEPAETDIQVVIVDGDERSRLALRQGLRSQPGLEVASEATNGETGLVLLDSIGVDVVVVTAPLPDMAIADFIQRVQAQNPCQPIKLVVLTDNPTGLNALGAAHCPRQSPMATLAEQIRDYHPTTPIPAIAATP